jgi:hypothetical protein
MGRYRGKNLITRYQAFLLIDQSMTFAITGLYHPLTDNDHSYPYVSQDDNSPDMEKGMH